MNTSAALHANMLDDFFEKIEDKISSDPAVLRGALLSCKDEFMQPFVNENREVHGLLDRRFSDFESGQGNSHEILRELLNDIASHVGVIEDQTMHIGQVVENQTQMLGDLLLDEYKVPRLLLVLPRPPPKNAYERVKRRMNNPGGGKQFKLYPVCETCFQTPPSGPRGHGYTINDAPDWMKDHAHAILLTLKVRDPSSF